MQLRRSTVVLALTALVGVLAMGCGSSSLEIADDARTTPTVAAGSDETPTAVAAPTATASTAPTETPQPTPDAEAPDPGARTAVAEALDGAAGATRYRVTTSQGQVMRISGTPIDVRTEADPDRPLSMVVVTPEGVMQVVDLSESVGLDGVGFTLWYLGDVLIVDSRPYELILDVNPAANLGPFRPGVATVDLATIDEAGPDALAAVTGGPIPDIDDVADGLLNGILDVEETAPGVFTALVSYGEVSEALGNDLEQVTASMGAAMALNLDADPFELAEFYLEVFQTSPAEVEIVLEDGRLAAVRVHADLSAALRLPFEADDPLNLALPEADRQAAAAAAADAVFETTIITTYDVDPTIELPTAPTPDEDRTAEWLVFLGDAGLLD